MIAIATEDGRLIRLLESSGDKGVFGFHSVFGFVGKESAEDRARARRKRGLKTNGDWKCEFTASAESVSAISNCQIESAGESSWHLVTSFGRFLVSEIQDFGQDSGLGGFQDRMERATGRASLRDDKRRFGMALGASVLLVLLLFLVLPRNRDEVAPPTISEPVEVKLVQEIQKAVQVPEFGLALPQNLAAKMTRQAKVAVAQNLGFLSMLGRKDLSKALGGMPTIQGASAGAGAGGKQGSGGELLVGLGEGVTRATVGNSGVQGLGGIGTKGAGGGGGGYGTSMIGSGNGRGLSSIPLSQDMILEGGLDRSVIQATIAKYLNQVRSCYEEGLRTNPQLVGQVSIAFEILGTGTVGSSEVAKSSLGNSEVEQCISRKVLTWRFPQPRGGVNVKVNYPFMLRPVKT